jgi:tetratricopeptide (TPR) repeat protein
MTIEAGMALYRDGNYEAAADVFYELTKTDGDNPILWNALGICYSRSGQYEDADTCFDNALMLSPGNVTYEKNLTKNREKIPGKTKPPDKKEPVREQQRERYYDYHRNWLQVPLFFVPIICFIINPFLGILGLVGSAWYIKYDADNLNAGSNPNGSTWGKLKGWEWAVLLFFFWILLPLYSWKRETVYNDNLGYGYQQQVRQSSGMSLGKIVVGGIVFLFLCVIVAAFVYGMAGAGTSSPIPTISISELKNTAKDISYEELSRYPEKYKGQPIRISGQVSQVLDTFGGVQLRMFTKASDFSPDTYFENDVFVEYPSPKERVLEKDIITIYGYADGIQDYTTVLGAQRSIPKIRAVTHTR